MTDKPEQRRLIDVINVNELTNIEHETGKKYHVVASFVKKAISYENSLVYEVLDVLNNRAVIKRVDDVTLRNEVIKKYALESFEIGMMHPQGEVR